jgi:hypothetical protein
MGRPGGKRVPGGAGRAPPGAQGEKDNPSDLLPRPQERQPVARPLPERPAVSQREWAPVSPPWSRRSRRPRRTRGLQGPAAPGGRQALDGEPAGAGDIMSHYRPVSDMRSPGTGHCLRFIEE